MFVQITYNEVQILEDDQQVIETHPRLYAKLLKLSHLRTNCASYTPEHVTFLKSIFEQEIEQREASRINLLLKQAHLSKCGIEPFVWRHVQVQKMITSESILNGSFIAEKENLILYGGIGGGKTYLSKLIVMNAISRFGYKIGFYTLANLVNQLVDANQKGQLAKLMN